MGTINFTIASGAAPFVAELVGSEEPDQNITLLGTYQFANVENGVYTLRITDANGCVFEREITVNPSVTTTTTTVIPTTSIVVGHTQDPVTIFNPSATNRNSEYSGFPDVDVVELYLWFKTKDGTPLTTTKTFDYSIEGQGTGADSTFEFDSVSDEIHMEVQEGVTGPISPLTGTIVLNIGFIESYFKYIYNRGATNRRFQIELGASVAVFDPSIETLVEAGTTYGIASRNNLQVFLSY